MISAIISRLVILVFGTLYPAYASYKAVRTKNLKEYVKWMMYWIVFALFTCTETFTDVFLSWFPFYYEVKIVLVLWLLSPATKGSSILYRKFVHPALCRREQEIDEYIAKAKDQGYHTVLNLGTKGVNYATTVIMQTAIKGGGGLVQQLRKSYSLSDLTECDPREERGSDEADDVLTEPRLIRRGGKSGYSTRRSASESNSRSPMYFPEVDVDVRPRARTDEPDFSHIKSSEDISSGYSSADNSASLTRTSSLGASARARGRTSRTTVTSIKRPQAAEGNEVIIEELQDDDTFEYANMPPLVNLPSQIFLSQTQPPFLYRYVGDKVEILQVLGDLPLDSNSNKNDDDNTDHRDQKEVISEETSIKKITTSKENTYNNNAYIEMNTKEIVSEEYDVAPDIPLKSQNSDNNDDQLSPNDKFDRVDTVETDVDMKHVPISVEKDDIIMEIMSHDTSNDFDSAESDDEASFGTPEDSPKSKRKSPKGKYGKGKAPAPPKVVCSGEMKDPVNSKDVTNEENLDLSKDEPKDFSLEKNKELSTENKEDMTENCKDLNKSTTDLQSTTSIESLVDIAENLSHTPFPETLLSKTHQLVVNPISEKKRRHKSKSPIRMPKSNSSGLGKLLQLPSKLAFWHKNEDKQAEEISTSSDDRSRRSSTLEGPVDDFQSCHELDVNTFNDICLSEIQENSNSIHHKEQADDQISFKDATDLESEIISQDIIDKSDALQKLIEAKIESHPEYKYISLHDETPTTSKTTDV